jgi:hypothetical protein
VRDTLGPKSPARTVKASPCPDNPIKAPRMATHRLWPPMPNKNPTPPTQPPICADMGEAIFCERQMPEGDR